MPDGTLLGAHASGGVQARPKGYDRGKFWKQLFVPIPATPEQTDGFHTFLRAQIGKPYDFEAILGIVAQRDWRKDKAWMCSELKRNPVILKHSLHERNSWSIRLGEVAE